MTHITNGKRPQGIYAQMMAMEDKIYYPHISKEVIDRIWNECAPKIKELDFLTIFGTCGGEINLELEDKWYNENNI